MLKEDQKGKDKELEELREELQNQTNSLVQQPTLNSYIVTYHQVARKNQLANTRDTLLAQEIHKTEIRAQASQTEKELAECNAVISEHIQSEVPLEPLDLDVLTNRANFMRVQRKS